MPVTLVEAKAQLQMDGDDSRDAEIAGFLKDAVDWVEKFTGQILDAREVTEQFRGFKAVELRAWPIDAGAVPGVAYVDAAGAPVSVIGARLDLSRRPARILPPSGSFFPFRDSDQLFTVTIRAGYEPGAFIPGNFRRAILVLVAAYDADREGGDVLAKAEASARRLCDGFRVRRL